jgi:hypothetical protein
MNAIWPLIWFTITLIPLGLLRVFLIILGLFIVPIAIPFAVKQKSNSDAGQEILTYNGLFWLWGNDHDGLLGDRRAKWSRIWFEEVHPKLKWLSWTKLVTPKTECFMAKYIWAAFRNPANNLRFCKLYKCDLERCEPQDWVGDKVVSDRVGRAGKHFIWAYPRKSMLPYCGYYCVRMWSEKQIKCIRIRLGFKIDAHDTDAVGFCTVISLYKEVHKND